VIEKPVILVTCTSNSSCKSRDASKQALSASLFNST